VNERIKVADVGRCSMDDLSRFSAKPGDCLKRVDVVASSQARVTEK
jgi:hypothetical protein